jgi:all-trans-retinol 13,14-reductase
LKKWSGWRSEYANNKYDVIIIGSGISGLTSGILLAKEGKKVLILEKHFKAGGWTHTFKRDNYEWDVGIHYIGEVHNPRSPVRKLFDLVSDGKLEWHKMEDNYDRIIFPDKQYNFVAPREKFIQDMAGYFPGTEDKMRRYIQVVDEAVKSGQSYFANKALPNWLGNFTYNKMTRKFFSHSDKTTREVIMDIFDDETILGVLSGQWGDHGLPPGYSSFAMHAMVVRHYLDGGNYPIGTSRRIAETAVDYLESMGGALYVNAGVDEIITHKGKAVGVRLEKGDEILAPLIISSAGVMNTYGNFLRNNKAFSQMSAQLKTVTPTSSYMCLYIGLNKSAEELKLGNTNLWIYPGYNHDQNVANYMQDSTKELPVVYVSFPSAKDPAFKDEHPGFATMEAITVANWSEYDNWKDKPWKNRGDEYETMKDKLSERILEKVYEHVPQAKEAMAYSELSTPLSVKSLANYPEGELYGIDHAPDRFHQKWLKPKSEIKNLYLTGQDVLTVGVTSALFSGLVTASAITKKNLMKELFSSTETHEKYEMTQK